MAQKRRHKCGDCPAARYLCQAPENLVVNGYRNWISGLANCDETYWEAARQAHTKAFGSAYGQLALEALASLVIKLGSCASCPLRFYKPGAGHLCRDECLLLVMIASAQSGDEEALVQSAKRLTSSSDWIEVIDRACAYAGILLSHNHRLTPIPLNALVDIDLRSSRFASQASSSIH